MILEIAEIEIIPGKEAEFESALKRAVEEVLAQSKGFIQCQLQRGIEEASRFTLLIQWETLEDHTLGFRQSDHFLKWREIIGPFFAQSPKVAHASQVLEFRK